MEARTEDPRQLRSPDADKLRAACAAAADRLSRALGASPAMTVPDWNCHRGTWTMSWSWLLPKGWGRLGVKNMGFRVITDGRQCKAETWAMYLGSLTADGFLPESTLNEFLDLSFGVAAQFRYASS